MYINEHFYEISEPDSTPEQEKEAEQYWSCVGFDNNIETEYEKEAKCKQKNVQNVVKT